MVFVLVGNCSLIPAPKDGGIPRFVPKDDGTLSAVPAPEDDKLLRPVPVDGVAWEAEDVGIEKLNVGCLLICELLVLTAD